VYLAEQEEPVRRLTALKIIKVGMESGEVLARFAAERQALALMDHPNVAKVFDAGLTPTGRPYFVMQHVPGVAMTEYCERHRLSTEHRLRLFVQACDAIHHAHGRGVIHRDVKPSNLLVTLQGDMAVVKVIDFGVAKAISRPLTDLTIVTDFGQLLGTPAYMSPEQAEMQPLEIDGRTDVYALGVVLYELLVGMLPLDPALLRGRPLIEIQRLIRESEAPRPSTRLARLGAEARTVAARHRTDCSSLLGELRGDLDWITMMAIDKDRTRRYATASDLAADVHRHLAREPVRARPPSPGYCLRKYMRRHHTMVVLVISVLTALIIGFSMGRISLTAPAAGGASATRSD
jgi:serine/threonine protein kinase